MRGVQARTGFKYPVFAPVQAPHEKQIQHPGESETDCHAEQHRTDSKGYSGGVGNNACNLGLRRKKRPCVVCDHAFAVNRQLTGVPVRVDPLIPFGVPPPHIFQQSRSVPVPYTLLGGYLLHTHNPEHYKAPEAA